MTQRSATYSALIVSDSLGIFQLAGEGDFDLGEARVSRLHVLESLLELKVLLGQP